MIVGIGIDQVEVARMAGFLERWPDRGPARVFTREERSVCGRRAAPAECYAARFAAKEAFVKALGSGLAPGMRWREIEVVSGAEGRPRLRISGRAAERLREAGGRSLHLSCTHDAGMAAAVVVIEG